MTYYFYDLETSGRSPRDGRIIQFAGQRTDTQLNPLGEPHNILIKLTPDILPEPDAVLTHGITPQRSLAEGIAEAEFLKIFEGEVAKPDTIFVGFNNIRFDDEFIRFTLWRNFYDAYEWAWRDGASRWDLLDVVRMTRALRPDGINWPKTDAGNRLETLAELNNLEHVDAHDALSDVDALISLTNLIKTKQPKLFDYLLNLRDKNKLRPFVTSGSPFVYTSGSYPKETLHTSVAVSLGENSKKSAAFTYDLRFDPAPFIKMTPQQLANEWRYKPWGKDGTRPPQFPVKDLAYNRCAAVAPMSVLDEPSQKRLKLDMSVVKTNIEKLKDAENFKTNIAKAWEILYPDDAKKSKLTQLSADAQLYDGFISSVDKVKTSAVRAAKPDELNDFAGQFADQRLEFLLPLYKARNWPKSLNDEEQKAWAKFCQAKLTAGGEKSQVNKFFTRLNQLGGRGDLSPDHRFLLEELNLYAQSILPST